MENLGEENLLNKTLDDTLKKIESQNNKFFELISKLDYTENLQIFYDFNNNFQIFQLQLQCIKQQDMIKQQIQMKPEHQIIIQKDLFSPLVLNNMIQQLDMYFLNQFDVILTDSTDLINKQKQQEALQMMVWKIQILKSQLDGIIESVPKACLYENTNLHAKNQDDEEWIALNKKIEYRQLQNHQNIQRSLNRFHQTVYFACAMVQNSQVQNPLLKCFLQAIQSPYYMLMQKESEKLAQLFYANPDQNIAFEIWNLQNNFFFAKQAVKLVFESVKFCKKIYIEKIFKEISSQAVNDIKMNYLDYLKEKIDLIDEQTQQKFQAQEIFFKKKNYVKVRILCNYHLNIHNTSNQVLSNDQQQNCQKIKKSSIIIHVHGGGFVSTTSFTHQSYTRKWANQLGIPIFSIDYAKAPQYQFPFALDQIWQSYLWIINFAESFLDFQIDKIILIGDSAGGNLVTVLTSLCILHQIRIPDGILLSYAALNLNIQSFTPSHIFALQDKIIPHKMIKICLQSYFDSKYQNAKTNFMLSPVYTPDEILEKFPPVRFQVGDQDSLLDDNIIFLNKLRKLNKDVFMIQYKGLGHGFLNQDFYTRDNLCQECLEDSIKFINELITK